MLLAVLATLPALGAQENPAASRLLPPQLGHVHGSFLEWEVTTTAYDGDPYDVQAFAEFMHEAGATYTVPLFYAGDDTWRLRFSGPRVGSYSATTRSDHDGLAGLDVRATFAPNPDPRAIGFMVPSGDAFAVLVGDGSRARRTIYNVYQRHDSKTDPDGVETAAHLSDDPRVRGRHIEALLDEVERHGMQALFILVGNNWFSWPREYDEPVPDDVPRRTYPDPVTFEILEDVLARAQARRLFVHLWAWGDAENNNAPDGFGGINSPVDVRLQYYIAGRLGSIPNWTMSLGYDLEEWVSPTEARIWHDTLTSFNTLPRLVGAREFGVWRGESFELGANKFGYFSNDYRPESDFFDHALELFDRAHALPLLYERRFLHTRDDVWDGQTTRRALWQFTLAGGAGGIWGVLWGDGPEYPEPAHLRTHDEFWSARFVHDFERPQRLADGTIALHSSDGRRTVLYAEATDRITLDLAPSADARTAIAVDTRAPYVEIELRALGAEGDHWRAPYASDWAIAIGAF